MDPEQLEESIRVQLRERLGPALTELRQRSGKRQSEVASISGLSRSQVSRYEKTRELPNLVTLMKYLFAVDSDLRDLGAVMAALDREIYKLAELCRGIESLS